MKKIYILVNKYPNRIEPNVCVFIQQLVWTFADLGYECYVINPLPININIKYMTFPNYIDEVNENNKNIRIYYPKYISVGQNGKFLQKVRVRITTFFYQKSVEKIIKGKVKNMDTILYSHFICPAGVVCAKLSKKYGLNSFMAHGEAIYSGDYKYGNNYLKKVFKYLNGVIAVSTQNKNFLLSSHVIDENKIGVFPNGFREERFYKINKKEARKMMGFKEKDFIVGFCGSFDERKGILRLEKAVEKIDGVFFACAGKGELIPSSDKCILKQPVNNDSLIYFYNSLDIFVLPTKEEGCCNAIVEAIACGYPIISSNKSFNYELLDNENSILIDPDNIDEIANAINQLKNDKEKMKMMSNANIKKSRDLTLKNRAKNISIFFENKSESRRIYD